MNETNRTAPQTEAKTFPMHTDDAGRSVSARAEATDSRRLKNAHRQHAKVGESLRAFVARVTRPWADDVGDVSHAAKRWAVSKGMKLDGSGNVLLGKVSS